MTIQAVWIALLALTGVEVYLAYVNTTPALMLASLLGLSAFKAALIAGWFMHLRCERRTLTLALVLPAIVIVLLAAAGFLPDAQKLTR